MSRIVPGAAPAAVDAADGVVLVDPKTGRPMWPYASPDGRSVNVTSTMGVLFSDDFGGAAGGPLDPAKWDVYDGGLGAVTLSDGTQQSAIGSGVTLGSSNWDVGATTASALTLKMPAASSVEWWALSRQIFAGSEDILAVMSRSVSNANNSLFIGLVEVDVASGYPVQNTSAGVGMTADFRNRGGVDCGKSGSNTGYQAEAVGDNSTAAVTGAGTAVQALTSPTEVFVELEAVDIIVSTTVPDTVGARGASAARVSSQCPNDGKAYKLLIRAKNSGAIACNWTIHRILVKDGQEFRAEVSSGRGDQTAQKALAVNIAGSAASGAASPSVQGAFASNTAGSPNPVVGGGIARTAAPTVATAGRTVSQEADAQGRMVNQPFGTPGDHQSGHATATAASSSTPLIAAGGATIRNVVQTVTYANRDSAAHTFDLMDVSAVRHTVVIPAGQSMHCEFPGGLPAAALNTAWNFQIREAATTAVEVSLSAYQTTA